jgi:hypothetical protein
MSPSKKLAWKNVKVRLGDLIEWEQNPRRLTAKQADDLRDSMKKFDYVEPIVVDHDGKTLIGGHQRKRIMIQRLTLDLDTMIDARAPNQPLSEGMRAELSVRLNKNQGEWDFDMLANDFEVSELFEWGFVPKDFDMEDSAGGGKKEEDPTICSKCKRPL